LAFQFSVPTGAINSVGCLTTSVRPAVVCPIWSSVRPCLDTSTAFFFPIPYVVATESHPVRAWSARIEGTNVRMYALRLFNWRLHRHHWLKFLKPVEVQQQSKYISFILTLYAITRCDSVAATYGLGKTK
jgi:hypothetical protein